MNQHLSKQDLVISVCKPLIVISFLMIFLGCKENIIYTDVLPQLEIKITDSNGNLVSNAQVTIYLNESDWLNKTNKITQKQTDTNGTALFENLDESAYYFFAEKNDQNNLTSISYFTEPLRKNEIRVISTTIK